MNEDLYLKYIFTDRSGTPVYSIMDAEQDTVLGQIRLPKRDVHDHQFRLDWAEEDNDV